MTAFGADPVPRPDTSPPGDRAEVAGTVIGESTSLSAPERYKEPFNEPFNGLPAEGATDKTSVGLEGGAETRFITLLSRRKGAGFVKAWIAQTRIMGIQDGALILLPPTKLTASYLRGDLHLLRQAASEVWGSNLQVKILDAPAPSGRPRCS